MSFYLKSSEERKRELYIVDGRQADTEDRVIIIEVIGDSVVVISSLAHIINSNMKVTNKGVDFTKISLTSVHSNLQGIEGYDNPSASFD
ncbi:hypothetical protein TNCV_4717881 [Trichonephila clavipes]|nr:hypothetical protein TNCV_4717881 [Trichonephila clavipes]